MTWFKVDDAFWSHPKTAALSDAAQALWLRAGSWCAQHLTDGRVPRKVTRLLSITEEAAEELVEAGLWLNGGDSWTFHDWSKYQPTRADEMEKREKWRERQRRYRNAKNASENDDTVTRDSHRLSTRDSYGESEGEMTRDSTSPVPSRPVLNKPPRRSAGDLTAEELEEFEAWWTHYPKKADKGQARKSWRKAREKASMEELVDGAKGYATECAREGWTRGYIKNPSTWLNSESWANQAEIDLPESAEDTPWQTAPEAYEHPEERAEREHRAASTTMGAGATAGGVPPWESEPAPEPDSALPF